MTSRQENKLNMYLVVMAFLKAKAEMLMNLPRYVEFLAAFLAGIDKIKSLTEEQMFDKSGINKNKKQLKLTLVRLAADTSRKLVAFAKFTNNQLLLSEINFPESKLKYANNVELRKYVQGIYDRAQMFIAELESYGITADTQTALLAAINDFVEFIPQPRIVKTSGKRYTAEIVDAYRETDTALANIDTDIEIIKLKEPNLYKEYKSVRKIISMGTGSIALKGRVVDAITKEPIKNVSFVFTIKENSNNTALDSNGTIVKKSANKGRFIIKSMPDSTYNVVVTKNGYTTQKTTVAVTNGEMVKLEVELVKSEE